MKETFRSRRFARKNWIKLKACIEVMDKYPGQAMTLRQLFYQLVSGGVIRNSVKEYHNLGNLITNARYAGMLDWEAVEDGKKCVLIYLGEHDPSGLKMIEDIEGQLSKFGCWVQFIHAALKVEQVRKFNLPPNPTKKKDTRTAEYLRRFGSECWELDALPPGYVANLLDAEIERFADVARMEEIKRQEQGGLKSLRQYSKESRGGG